MWLQEAAFVTRLTEHPEPERPFFLGDEQEPCENSQGPRLQEAWFPQRIVLGKAKSSCGLITSIARVGEFVLPDRNSRP